MYYEKLDSMVIRMENKFGRNLWAAIVAFVSMAGAALYVRPAVKCVVHGMYYAELARNPFAFSPDNPVSFRILTPLISWMIGLRGEYIIITNLIIAAWLIALVYIYFRHHAPRPADALIAAAVVTFSLVTLTTIYYGGYCDSATYLLIFLMYWLRKNRIVFYLLFFLALLNRESAVFLIPWFAFLSYHELSDRKTRLLDLLVGFGITLVLYILIRRWVGPHGENLFTIEYYIKPMLEHPDYWLRRAYVNLGLGFFSVYKILWLFAVAAVISLWRLGDKSQVWSIMILLGCTWAQMIFAYDSSRMMTMGFMIMIVSLIHLFREDPYHFRRWAGPLLIVNLFVPQLYTAAGIIEQMHSTFENILLRMFWAKKQW